MSKKKRYRKTKYFSEKHKSIFFLLKFKIQVNRWQASAF